MSNAADRLDSILGPLTLDGGLGSDTVHLVDFGRTQAATYTVTESQVARGGIAAMSYARFESLVVYGSTGGDTFDALGTAFGTTTTLNGWSGDDVFVVDSVFVTPPLPGSHEELIPPRDTILGPLVVFGSLGDNLLHILDAENRQNSSYTLGPDEFSRSGLGLVSYSGLSALELDAGSGDDVLVVDGIHTAIVNVDAGAGADLVTLAPGAVVTGTVRGQLGLDTLDYSGRKTAVVVNLLEATATDIEGGIDGFENVWGGSGDDVLVGDAAANELRCHVGRDVLIGGRGADHLFGGDGEDLLISGSTSYATDADALAAIAAEWSRLDRSYSKRIASLTNGVGASGTICLTKLTVTGDGEANELRGEEKLDWFFASLTDATDRISLIGEQLLRL